MRYLIFLSVFFFFFLPLFFVYGTTTDDFFNPDLNPSKEEPSIPEEDLKDLDFEDLSPEIESFTEEATTSYLQISEEEFAEFMSVFKTFLIALTIVQSLLCFFFGIFILIK